MGFPVGWSMPGPRGMAVHRLSYECWRAAPLLLSPAAWQQPPPAGSRESIRIQRSLITEDARAHAAYDSSRRAGGTTSSRLAFGPRCGGLPGDEHRRRADRMSSRPIGLHATTSTPSAAFVYDVAISAVAYD